MTMPVNSHWQKCTQGVWLMVSWRWFRPVVPNFPAAIVWGCTLAWSYFYTPCHWGCSEAPANAHRWSHCRQWWSSRLSPCQSGRRGRYRRCDGTWAGFQSGAPYAFWTCCFVHTGMTRCATRTESASWGCALFAVALFAMKTVCHARWFQGGCTLWVLYKTSSQSSRAKRWF